MRKEYDFCKLERALEEPVQTERKRRYGINLSPEVVGDYFKRMAEEADLPYRMFIDLYPLDCARKRKKLTMEVAWHRGDELLKLRFLEWGVISQILPKLTAGKQ